MTDLGEKEPKQMNSRVSLRSPTPPSWPQTPECSRADARKLRVGAGICSTLAHSSNPVKPGKPRSLGLLTLFLSLLLKGLDHRSSLAHVLRKCPHRWPL